jgi:hypothetical protein
MSTMSSISPRSCSELADKPEKRLLTIFDWDDTLFPTTYLHERNGTYTAKGSAANTEYAKALVRVLWKAKEHGDVCIVTFAKRPWVHSTMAALLPLHLHDFLEVEGIPVFYAREFESEDSQEKWSRGFSGAPSYKDMRRNELLIAQKNAAMMHVIKMKQPNVKCVPSSASVSTMASLDNYSRGAYTQIVAIGDGDCEMIAAHDLALRCSSPIVTKTVKLMNKPSFPILTSNLGLLADDFGALAAHERDAHVIVRECTPLKTLLEQPESQNFGAMYEKLFPAGA